MDNDLLYYDRSTSKMQKRGKVYKRLVVPTEYIIPIIEEFHSSPIMRHLGREKTYARIIELFY